METIDTQAAETQEPIVNIDFRRYFAALRKYVWLVVGMVVAGIACAIVYATRVTPIFEAKASVQIEPRLPDLLGTGDLFQVAAAGANTNEYYKQQRQVLGSYTLCSQTVGQFDLAAKLDPADVKGLSHDDLADLATRRLTTMITVTYPEQDRIMYVAVRDPDPQLATDIANDQIATYINYAKGLLSVNSNQASEALQAQFNDAEAKLRLAEDKIYKFESDNDMITVTLEEHQNLVSQNILSLSQKLNDATAAEISLRAKLAEMRREDSEDTLSSPIIMLGDNPSFQTLRTQYFTEKTHLIELEKDLGGKNPDYLAQKQKVDLLFKALEGELKILVRGTQDLYTAAAATTAGIAAEVEKHKDEARRLSPKIVQYNELAREKKQVEDSYNILRARLSTTQMTNSMSQVMSNVHPLDPALVPTKPVSPNMLVDIVIGAVLALLLGFGVILLFVFFDRSVKTAIDATQAAGVPVLGIIPALTEAEVGRDMKARDLYIHEHPTSHVAECCRILRTNIMFTAADQSLKTLVVCSANAKEGKTTTVIYLGITMAQSGQRVLLIDTDMRRPRLHVSTGVAREPGLSNLIVGDDNYDEVIKPTVVPNLFILPCGPLPPNPAELLMTKRFETVLAELGKRFTRIILDSPPLQPVTDAVVLAKRSDGAILVARSGSTIREELKRASKMIRTVGGTVLGVVVNELDRRDRDSYYYHSYYGYSQSKDESPAVDSQIT